MIGMLLPVALLPADWLLRLIFPAYEVISSVLAILIVVFWISVDIRRLHDLGKSGWFLLWGLIPGVAFVLVIYLLFAKGEAGSNKYGDIPSSKIRFPQDALAI